MKPKTPTTVILGFAAGAMLLSGCSSAGSSSNSSDSGTGADGVSVVATTSMLGDVVGQIVGCGGGSVTVLMPIGTDPHDFSASSDQVAGMVNADLVVANGLGLEAGLDDSFSNAESDGANIFEVAPQLNPIELGAGMHAHEGEELDDHGDLDPHFWFDMNRMATAAQLIGAELTAVTGEETYTTCADTTASEITAAETEVRAILESVPVDQRILVTDHDALGYLADTYGFEIAGTLIPSGSTLAEASSADLAALVETINAEGVPAIFANVAEPAALAEAVAAETGTNIAIIPLYVGSLGAPDSSAATYIDMMRTDAQLIADGLTG